MLVTVDTAALIKQLDAAVLQADNAFRHMVSRFTENVVRIASDRTRMGSNESIQQGMEDDSNNISSPEANYFRMYQNRSQEPLGLPIQAGFHKGAWRAQDTGTFSIADTKIYDTLEASNKAGSYVENNYTHGETFWIGAMGPAFSMLNDANAKGNHTGYSLGDITVEDIEAIYGMSPRLKQYFNEVMPE